MYFIVIDILKYKHEWFTTTKIYKKNAYQITKYPISGIAPHPKPFYHKFALLLLLEISVLFLVLLLFLNLRVLLDLNPLMQ